MQAVIAFLGGGNMAGALIGGLLKAGRARENLRVCEVNAERAAVLRQQFGVTVTASVREACQGAQAIVLAVKPQQAAEVLRELQPTAGTTLVSIAAGVQLASLQKACGTGCHYVRTMPNTPALLGQGITGLYAPPGTPAAARELAESILKAAGQTVWLEREEDMDAVTALSGSGPAYFFLLTEVLREAGVKLGLKPDVAAQLAQQTFIGTAAMAAQPGADVVSLRNNVTSKGGTTEAAVKHLEAQGIRPLFADALRAAQQRSQELGSALSAAQSPIPDP